VPAKRSEWRLALVPLALAACAGVPSASPTTAAPTAAAVVTPAAPALLAAMRAKVPINPVPLAGDPYLAWRGREPPVPPPGSVCGIRFEADGVRYRLEPFRTTEAARAAGFAVTHVGTCGTCSTLQDLAVYLERPDLTSPVRRCGMRINQGDVVTCLEALGFSGACEETWAFNARNTKHACFFPCMLSWVTGEPSTGPDGRLNDCLQCDEDRSGPVFKAVAGRTRRNSGIRSSIPRPEEQVAPVVHDYLPPAAAATGGGG
jgi:hypothetical protein